MFTAPCAAIEDLHDNVQHFSGCSSIPVLQADKQPTAFEFLRDYVSKSRPCLIRNAIHKPLPVSTVDDLIQLCPELKLNIDVSPDGSADVVRSIKGGQQQRMFVLPEERQVSVQEFASLLRRQERKPKASSEILDHREFELIRDEDGVEEKEAVEETTEGVEDIVYYSRQNDCLRMELPPNLVSMFPKTFEWAEQAFATGPPQAINLWIGNQRSVSSMHKDPYENLFYVLSGEKIFVLCPPADAPFLYEQAHAAGRFRKQSNKRWYVQGEIDEQQQQQYIHWIAADVTRKDDPTYMAKYPLLKYTHTIHVTVKAGDLLYLPALWFHRVTQSCETVAINYWYDMQLDTPIWTMVEFLRQLEPV